MFKNFVLTIDTYIIRPCKSIKLLGTHNRQDFKWDTEVGKLASTLHNRIFNIKKLTPYTNFHTRLQFLNGYVIGKLRYMLPLYSNVTQLLMTKLHKIVMTAARTAIGNYCCRHSTTQILNKVDWLPIKLMIEHSAINIIHSILTKKTPNCLLSLYNMENRRQAKEITTKYLPKTTQFGNFYIYKCIKTYNNLPNLFKIKSKNVFKKSTKKWLITNGDSIPDSHD